MCLLIIDGKVTDSPLTSDDIMAAVEADDYTGLCAACGAEKDGCEPDARRYECDECGEMTVYGAEELLMMIG